MFKEAKLILNRRASLLFLESLSLLSLVGNPFSILVYGTISNKGHSLNKNDRWFVKEHFCQPDIVDGLALHFFIMYQVILSSFRVY